MLLFATFPFATWTLAAVTDADPDKIFSDPNVAALAKADAAGDAAHVRLLITRGADPNGKGDRDVNLLEWSLLQQSARGMTALLDGGADPAQPGVGGATVLHMAAMANDIVYLRTLLDHGADPNTPHGTTGAPPLSAALMNPDGAAFDLLLAHHADPNRADRLGNTPLQVAAEVHKPDCVLRLLESGADAGHRNLRGDTFQAYFNIAPAGGFSTAAQAKHDAVHAWLRTHGVAVETSAR
ncbi:MAG: ankyrin repeat domain-containing protein [Dokdonella sp.]